MSHRKFNIISLFAGAGGLEIGACSTGQVDKIVSTDSSGIFLQTVNDNLPKHFPDVQHSSIVADVREVTGAKLLDCLGAPLDLVMGGPPCDDFTQYGRRLGMAGEKAPLIFEYLRLVDELRPRCFLFENVPNLARQFKQIFKEFLQRFEDLGYRVDWRLLSAAGFGAPTQRKRIIAVGWLRGGITSSEAFMFPLPTHGGPTDANLFTGFLKPFVTVADVLADLPDVKEPGAAQYYNHTGRTHRPKTVEHMKTVPQGVCINKSFRYRAPWNNLCRSLTAGLDDGTKSYLHPFYHREMSVREYARLQGFPDTWVFSGNHHNGIKQIANAVPIQLGGAVLTAVLEALSERRPGAIL